MGMRGSLGLILYQVVVLNSTSYPENMSPQLFSNSKIRTIWIFGGKVHQTQAIPLVFPIGFTEQFASKSHRTRDIPTFCKLGV